MTKLEAMKMTASRVAGRGGLLLKKHSPEILLVAGIGGLIGSTVMACKASGKAEAIADKAAEKFKVVDTVLNNPDDYEEEYTEKDAQKDKLLIYVQTAVEYTKLYGPAFSLGVVSIASILASHNIMRKRNLAIVAAYKAVEQSFTDYRERVAEEFGKEKDHQFKSGILYEEVTVEQEVDGKKKKTKVTKESYDPNHYSQYARFFDETSTQWSDVPEYNMLFLKGQQNHANDLLIARGHLFLNDVYDMLGIDRSQAGQMVGWALNEDGDNFVDFGMYDLHDANSRRFINGHEAAILLDFNVQGVMYDLI